MKPKVLVVNIVLVVLLSNAGSVIAQKMGNPTLEWQTVKALPAGDHLRVQLKDGKKIEGTMRNASDSVLMLTRGTTDTDLNRDTIAKVHRVVPRSVSRSVGKSTAMGAGIGFGTGAVVGIWGGSYEDLDTLPLVGFLGGFGAAIGAGIGALVGAVYVKPKRVLIYEFK